MDKKERSKEIESLKPLMDQVKGLKVLTAEEERILVKKAQEGDKRAMDELVRKNLRLVVKKAKYFMGKGVPLADLVQEGSTGIIRAVEKFDLSRNLKLSTYATLWIEQRVRRAIEHKAKIVKIPLQIQTEITKLKKKYKEITEENDGNPPTSEELAKALGITTERAKELGRIMSQHVSLDENVGEDDHLSIVDYLIDEDFLPEDKVEFNTDKEYTEYLLSFLTKSDSNFIKIKYGFIDHQPKTEKQMAMLLKIKMKEVKSRETRILNTLKSKASMFSVNMSIPCDVYINEIMPEKYVELVEYLDKTTTMDHTDIRIMLANLPCKCIESTDQHLALIYKEELEQVGALVEISKSL